MDSESNRKPSGIDTEIDQVAKAEWRRTSGGELSEEGRINCAVTIIDRAIAIIRSKPSRRIRADVRFTKTEHVSMWLLNDRIGFSYRVEGRFEYLSLTVDHEELDIELTHRKRGGLKKAEIVVFEDLSEDDPPIEGSAAAQRANGLVDAMASLLEYKPPKPQLPQETN